MTTKHPGQRRLATQQQENEDDIFVANVLEAGNWAKRHQQLLTILGVAVVLVVAGLIYYSNYREAHVEQAANQLEQIHQSVALQDIEGAKDQLVLYLDRFGGTPYAGEARMLLGELYLRTGAPEQAIAVLEPMASSPRNPVELQAAALLGTALEQEQRWEDAEATYLRIADRSDLDFQVRDALASAARIRAQQGDGAGAAELYRRILEQLDEDAPERGLYEMRLAEVTHG